jgi:hypothetical protein
LDNEGCLTVGQKQRMDSTSAWLSAGGSKTEVGGGNDGRALCGYRRHSPARNTCPKDRCAMENAGRKRSRSSSLCAPCDQPGAAVDETAAESSSRFNKADSPVSGTERLAWGDHLLFGQVVYPVSH